MEADIPRDTNQVRAPSGARDPEGHRGAAGERQLPGGHHHLGSLPGRGRIPHGFLSFTRTSGP